MLVDFPREWRKYFVDGKVRTFSSDTPDDVIKKAKAINEKMLNCAGKVYFQFENKPAQQ